MENLEINLLKDPSKLVHSQTTSDLTFSYFYEGLEYWNENNSSNDYETFYQKMISTVGPNLAIVLHYKDFIVQSLFESIRQENSFALVPFINLVCLIGKDLRGDFYSAYGRETFSLLANLLKTNRDPLVIEAVFMCITYLFKYLAIEIINDCDALSETFALLLYLPNEKHFYNRKFMSEALGFLIKRTTIEHLPALLKSLLDSKWNIEKFEENFSTFSSMLFYSIKSVKGSLHSRSDEILTCFCQQIENFNGKTEIILCLMELLLQHFDEGSKVLHQVFKTYFFPLVFHISSDMNKTQIHYLFEMLRKILSISRNHLLPDCINFMQNIYYPIANELSIDLQAIALDFLFFIIQSVTFKEIMELKVLKIIEQLLIDRPIQYCLWALFNLSQMESIGHASKSILNELNIKAVDSIYQLAMLKFLGLDEDKINSMVTGFKSSFSVCQKIFFNDLVDVKLEIQDFSSPLVLKYANYNFDPLEKASEFNFDLVLLIQTLIGNLSCTECESLRYYSLKLLEKVTGNEESAILGELEKCQSISLSFHTYKNKIVHLRNIEILLNSSTAISTIAKQIVARYLIGEIYFSFSYYSKEVFKIIRDLVGKVGEELFTVWREEFVLLNGRECCDNLTESPVECSLEEFDSWLLQWYKQTAILSSSLSIRYSYKISQLFELLSFVPKMASNYDFIVDFFIENHSRISLNHLLAILKFFSQISAITNTDLYNCILSLLISSNEQIQQFAMKACFSFQKSICHFNEQEREILLNLIDDKTFKNEILSLTLSESRSLRIPPEIKSNIIGFIVRILYGKMGKKFHNSGLIDARRKMIFSFFSTLEMQDLILLFKLTFRPFLSTDEQQEFVWSGKDLNQMMCEETNDNSMEIDDDTTNSISHSPSDKQCIGVLVNVKEIISQLANFLRTDKSLANTIFDCLSYCLSKFHQHSQIRALSLKRLSELFELDLTTINVERIENYFIPYFKSKSQSPEIFCRNYFQIETSAVLCLLVSFSRFQRYHFVFDRCLLFVFISSLEFDFVPLKVKEIILQLLNRIFCLIDREMKQFLFRSITSFIKSFSTAQMKKNYEVFEEIFTLIQNLTINHEEFSQKRVGCKDSSEQECNFIELSTMICTFFKQHSSSMQLNQKSTLLRIINSLIGKDSSLRQIIFESLSEQMFLEDELEIRSLLISTFEHFIREETKTVITGTNAILVSPNSNPSVFFAFNKNLSSFEKLPLDESLLIVFNLMFFVNCSDFAWRSNAVESVKLIVNQTKGNEFYDEWIRSILNCIKQLLKLQVDSVSTECYSIFHQIILSSSQPSFQIFKEENSLFSVDSESNYFTNILHLQLHRRIRALNRLKVFATENSSFQLDVFCDFFLPVIHQYCYSGNYDLNLTNEAISTVSSVLSRSHESFHRINGYLKKIKKDKYKKISMKIICQMCESVSLSPSSTDFIDYLDKFVFPILQENLFKKSSGGREEKVSLNSSLIIAMTSLLKKCRETDLNRRIPRIVFVIGNVLKSKNEMVRKESRECLVRVFQILGTSYANFLFKELIATLNRGGYHAQVLTSTIRFLLNSIDSLSSSGVKTLLQLLFPLALSSSQSGEEFQIMQAASLSKGIPLIFERLAQIASDVECFEISRSFFHDNSSLITNTKERAIIGKLIEHYSIGLGKNKNLSLKSLLSISFVLLDENQPNEWFTSLALGNLRQVLKNNENFEDETLLIPFLRILPIILVKLNDPSMVRLTLACICLLHERITSKSIWIDSFADESALLFLLDLASNSNPSSAEIRKSFGLAIRIICLLTSKDSIRNCPNFQSRIKGLALMISTSGTSRYEEELPSVLNLFSTIISLEIVFAEFFDIMEDQVFPLVLSCHLEEIRTLARQTFLSYLTKYPITTKRLQHVLCEKIVRNLDYDFEDGKLSCLELLLSLLQAISIDSYGESVEFLFMNFVLQIGNFDSQQLVDLIGKCIWKLVEEACLVQKYKNSLLHLTTNFLSHLERENKEKHQLIQSNILKTISFTPKAFLHSIDTEKIQTAIHSTIPTDSLSAIYRLMQNDFKVDHSIWESFILLDFLGAQDSDSCPLAVITCQLNLYKEFIEIIPAEFEEQLFLLCIRYAASPSLIACHDQILDFLIVFFKQKYPEGNAVCSEICKQLFAKFRIPTSNSQFLASFYLFSMRFFGAAVSTLNWTDNSQMVVGQVNSQILLETLRFLHFVEHNRKRLRLDDGQISLLNETLSFVRKTSPSTLFNSTYQQAHDEAEVHRAERKIKRAKERSEM